MRQSNATLPFPDCQSVNSLDATRNSLLWGYYLQGILRLERYPTIRPRSEKSGPPLLDSYDLFSAALTVLASTSMPKGFGKNPTRFLPAILVFAILSVKPQQSNTFASSRIVRIS